MALFSLDIERYYQSQIEEGFELKSIAYIQYPIYCIHATIIDSTPDPLEKLDKAIVKCIQINERMSPLEMAQLLGVQKSAIDMRIKQLKLEELIVGNKNLQITKLGNEIINEGKGIRQQPKSYNFYVDGIDLSPLNHDLYSPKYLKSFYDENEYTYYTNSKGETVANKPFRPNIVHEPLEKERVIENIMSITESERGLYSIPLGLLEIESIDFTKMAMPILIGILVKGKEVHRKLIDGFSPTGIPDKISSFKSKIQNKIDKLELRIDTWTDKKKEETKFSFASNWHEIDKEDGSNKAQFISQADFMLAIQTLYKLNISSEEILINTDFELGINVNKELLLSLKSNRKQFLRNLDRGRDYIMTSLRNGIWIVFIKFSTNCSFISKLLEIREFLKDTKNSQIALSNISERLFKYEDYRQILIFLEEYELLEKIDISQHMYISKNE